MALQSLTIGGARFRAGTWRADEHLAYLVPLSGAHTLTEATLRMARATLRDQGYAEVVTAAVAPPERAAFLRDGFVEREELHLLHHDLTGLPPGRTWPGRPWASGPARRAPTIRIERGNRNDRPAILALDAATFDAFWTLDEDGLDDALEATPVSRIRVIRTPEIVGYAVAGRAGAQGFLQRLAVDPAHQGRGFGTALVYDALRWMRRRSAHIAWVNTQEANQRALHLYEQLGFRPADHRLTVLGRALGEEVGSEEIGS